MAKLSAILIILFSASAIYAFDGEITGKIGEINKSTGEIIVAMGSKYHVEMGDKLYVRVNGDAFIMQAIFPMLTIVKCRLTAEYKGNLKDLAKGMVVYKYKTGIEKKEVKPPETGRDVIRRRLVEGKK